MRIVMSWLGEFVDLDGIAADDLAERLTLAGLEVTAVERVGEWWDPERLIVGAVIRVMPHPNADRLVLADVDLGPAGSHRVVTGAPNLVALREGGDLPRPMKVAYAREGAEIFDGHSAGWEKTVLKGRKVRGVMSDAMVCSEKELGLSDRHDEILVLEDEAPVGSPLTEVLGDVVLDVDVLPNFARAMSVVGVARETAVLFRRPFAAPLPGLGETTGTGVAELVTVNISDPDLCPRYIARLVDEVAVGPSPAAMARRLTMAGMRSLSNVVDATNYVMLEWGEPLHAFDYDALVDRAAGRPPRITVRRAKPGETMTTLDGEERTLDGDTLLIADDAGPVAIAGVMGGAETQVGAATTKVLLEAAAFDNIGIRRASRRQRIQSESAARFGRGVHPAVAEAASRRAAQLVASVAGGAVAGGAVDAYPRPPQQVVVELPAGEVRRLLGADLDVAEVTDT
ncbi:MAG: phenylalanine--tRNA ligase subunit beta, partial [Anaerolineae bacterium]